MVIKIRVEHFLANLMKNVEVCFDVVHNVFYFRQYKILTFSHICATSFLIFFEFQ